MSTDNVLMGKLQKQTFFPMFVFLFCVIGLVRAQESGPQFKTNDYDCGMKKVEFDPLIDEAEREQFNVKRVEFVGNTYTRGRDLFKSSRSVNEGDIFTRKNLELAIKRISKMGPIYPITIDNVEVRLDRVDRSIDIVFCVKQKPKQ